MLYRHGQTTLACDFASTHYRHALTPIQNCHCISDFLPVGAGLEARLDAVGGIQTPLDSSRFHSHGFPELVQSEDRFTEVKDALKHLCKVDLDKLVSSVRVRIKHYSSLSMLTTMQLASNETREANSARKASSRVTQMLNLKDVMRHLPALQKALVGSKSELLKIICNVRYGTLTAFSTYVCLVDVV